MLVINNKAKTLSKKLDNNFYIVADFDRTITKYNSMTSWSILSNTDLVSKEYIEERNKLYEYYRPIEIDQTIAFEKRNECMKEWFKKHLDLFAKYKLKEEVILTAAKDKNIMQFRDGAQEFLKYLYQNEIPLIIISAGIGNFIEQFLKINDCYYDNIYILSNYITFKNGVAHNSSSTIIHSLNKNEHAFNHQIKEKIKDKDYIILLGDQIDDIKMVSEKEIAKTIKIGFLDKKENLNLYQKSFDIIASTDANYHEIMGKLFLNKN